MPKLSPPNADPVTAEMVARAWMVLVSASISPVPSAQSEPGGEEIDDDDSTEEG